MSRAITKEEARKDFLDAVRAKVQFWAKGTGGMSKEEACDGVAFGILVLIDGMSGENPAMDLVLRPHEDDKQDAIENDKNYYEDGMAINDDIMLHDLWYPKESKQ